MSNVDIKMGTLPENWNDNAKSITFCVTEDCNLACKYCYMTGKNDKKKMTFEIAKKAIDYVLSNRKDFHEEAVVWDFIGGEPFLEIELIDRICAYIKEQLFLLNHPWFNAYRFSFSSNGLLYNTPKVQEYIRKNKHHLSIGISVDGNKIKHDLQRVKPDGTGSYDDVAMNVKLWQQQFPGASTKATFAHDDLPYLKESIISLWELGLDRIPANVVFEDVWHEGDDVIYENQLKELADYILEKGMWKEYSVRFFSPTIGFPMGEEEAGRNFCGSGNMLAIDTEGNLFPCIRFYDMSLSNRKGYKIGDIEKGIDNNRLRPFKVLTATVQSTKECNECEVASGCSWCTGFNYDTADTDTIYQRAIFICKMHKANVRACEYFWDRFTQVTGLRSPRDIYKEQIGLMDTKNLLFMESDNITPHCSYRNWNNTQNVMSREIFEKGMEFADKIGLNPILLGDFNGLCDAEASGLMRLVGSKSPDISEDTVVTFDNNVDDADSPAENCMLLVKKGEIKNIFNNVKTLYEAGKRINIVLEDIDSWDESDIEQYGVQLDLLVDLEVELVKMEKTLELNVLNDIINLKKMCNCDSGISTYTLAPNGKIYSCPAFYLDDPESYIGTLEDGITVKNEHLLSLEYAPICMECDAYHCRRCKFMNKKLTSEINTPSSIQCIISHIERNKARELQVRLANQGLFDSRNIMKEIDYLDPLDKITIAKGGCLHV